MRSVYSRGLVDAAFHQAQTTVITEVTAREPTFSPRLYPASHLVDEGVGFPGPKASPDHALNSSCGLGGWNRIVWSHWEPSPAGGGPWGAGGLLSP